MAALLDPGRIIALAHGSKPATFGGAMSADYQGLANEFLALLRGREIPFVVVGGIAMLQYVQGRNTDDIDLIISAPRLVEIPELEIRERSELFGYGTFRELRVDVLFREHPIFREVSERFIVEKPYQFGSMPTATVEGLILLKLFALPSLYRQFDYDRIWIYEGDVGQLLGRTTHDDAFFLSVLTPHIPESDRNELARILGDIRNRLRRMRQG